jgi:hypothetical protein
MGGEGGGAKYLYEGSEGNSLTVAWNEHILYIYIYLHTCAQVFRYVCAAHVKYIFYKKVKDL